MNRSHHRFSRQLDRLGRRTPAVGGLLTRLSQGGRAWVRLPAAVALIAGGLVGFLPVVGFWMLPLGLVLLAVDIPGLRPAVGSAIVRVRASLRRWRPRY